MNSFHFYKNKIQTFLIINSIPLFLLSSGCKNKVTSGLYVGNLSLHQGEITQHSPATIQLQLKTLDSAEISIKDIHQNLLDHGFITWDPWRTKINLSLSSLHLDSITLTRTFFTLEKHKNWRCYQGTQKWTVTLCHNKESFYIKATETPLPDPVYWLTGELSAEQEPITLEEPRSYRLSEALVLTQEHHFDSQIEYQRLIQAQESARAAYFNLIPHLNFKSAFAVSSLNPLGMINFVADFVPFVIPVRWIKAKEARELREAEEDTIQILKADLANQIAGFSYLYDQDRSDVRFYERVSQRIDEVILHLNDFQGTNSQTIAEYQFRLPVFANTIENEIIRLKNAILMDKMALALSLGLHNPNGVSDFDIEEEMDSIERASPANELEIAQASIERSLELAQLDHLIENANLQKDEYYFNWSDPDVPSSMSLSLSLIPYTAKAKSVIHELRKRREQTQSQILQKAHNAVLAYNFSLERYESLKRGEALVLGQINSTFDALLQAKSVEQVPSSIPSFFWSFQYYITYRTSIHATISKFRISRSLIRRLLLNNYYAPKTDFRVIGSF